MPASPFDVETFTGPDATYSNRIGQAMANPLGATYGVLVGKQDPKDEFASQTRAQLARSDYADWLDTFKPIEDELIGSYNNPAERGRMVGEAQERALGAIDTAEGSFRRRTRSLGMALTPEQEAAHGRRLDLTRGLSNVNAANMTRRRLKAQDQQLLTGMAPQGSALKYAQGT